jgi:predicted secreted Zn-dependent protease
VRLLPLLVLASASACVTVAPRERAPVVLPPSVWPSDTIIHWYDVEADTATELRETLDAKGPEDAAGQRHDAYTAWYVTWRFPFAQTEEGCSTGPVTTAVRVDVKLPRWRAPVGDGPLISKWKRYLESLREHESGHRETGFNAATEINEVLPQLPPKPTCEEAEAEANVVARQVLERHRQRDAEYDLETQHGATQGAVFP